MSNSIVGSIYEQIIGKVIEASMNDFEEFGIDQNTLQDLHQGWQKKLTALQVGSFPWEPQPAPASQPPTIPSNGPKDDTAQSPASVNTPGDQSNGASGGARIKSEENAVAGYPGMNGYSSGLDRNVAQQRAASLLQERFGQQADASIAGLTQGKGISLPGQGRPGGGSAGMQHRPAEPAIKQEAQISGQNDGADDVSDGWQSILSARQSQGDEGPSGRIVADRSMGEALDDLTESLDNGLMVPMDENPALQRKSRARSGKLSRKGKMPKSVTKHKAPTIPQLDGEYSDDEEKKAELDDEAINSDLDDSEDDLAQADDDDTEIGDTMLCTYDKVQRVKNKWKCTLKDGVLTTNGKDYLFHKATGEFEW